MLKPQSPDLLHDIALFNYHTVFRHGDESRLKPGLRSDLSTRSVLTVVQHWKT